jgi:hypothetical protein
MELLNGARRWIGVLTVGLLTLPGVGRAEEAVGVVTTLAGQATRTASASPTVPAPLRFKDDVFAADTIRTAERSLVRVLLERKALLTVRELSVLHITDEATRAIVNLQSGGVALSVARLRLRPGEVIEVHTPNALAAVRGTTIAVETRGAVTHFHVLTGALDVASLAKPTAWRRLQAPATVTVTGDVVGTTRALDDATRGRLAADYLGLKVAEPSAPAEVVAQEQAKAVLLARMIGGDGSGDVSGGDQVEALAVPEVKTQAGPGMTRPTETPVVPPVPSPVPAAPPVPAPLQTWANQTATVTGDLYNVPAATTATLSSGLASATGSAITVTNEVVDVTGTLTAGAATPLILLNASTLASRNMAQVQVGSVALTGGPLLETVGGGVSTTDDLVRVVSGGRLFGPATDPLLSLSGTALTVGNGAGDRLLELTGAGSRLTLGAALLDATGSTVSLTGTSLVEVSSGATLTAGGSSPLVGLTGGALVLNSAATGFLFSSASASTLSGGLLGTSGTDINAALASPGNLLAVSGPVTSTGTSPFLSLAGGNVRARNLGVVSSAAGVLTLAGAFLDRSGTGRTLATTDDLLNISAGGRLVGSGSGALLRFTDTTVNLGNGSGDQLFNLTGAGSRATLAGGLLGGSNAIFTLTGSSLVDVSSGAILTATGTGPLADLSGGSVTLSAAAAGFAISSTGASQIAGSLLRTANTAISSTGELLSVSGSLTGTGSAPLLDLTGGAVTARNGVLVSTANGRLTLNGLALSRSGGTFTTTDDLFNISGGGRLVATGTGALLSLSNATVSVGNATSDQLFVVTGTSSQATLAGPVLSASNTALSLTGSKLVEVSSSATLTDTAASRLVSLSGGTLQLGAGANAILLNSSGLATLSGGLLDTTGTTITAAGDFVRALGNGRIVVTGSTTPLVSLTGGTHQFGAAGNIYRLSGTATALDVPSGLLLGTEQPVQAAGSLFEAVGATATTQRAVRLDVALLQASAPLLSLRANGGVASALTTTSNTIDLTSRVKLNATAPVIALDGSRLTVNNASVVNVAGGSYLRVTGNLLSVANGSQITVTGGTLLFAAGGSVVNISGALLSFGGAGSTVTVSNTLCPCTVIGGIPVRLSGGALVANVSIANPIQNAVGNTVSIASGAAAIRVDGATTRVTISGQ